MAGQGRRSRQSDVKLLAVQACMAVAAFCGPLLREGVTLESDTVTYVEVSSLIMVLGSFALAVARRFSVGQRVTVATLVRLVFRAISGLTLGVAVFFVAAVLFGAPLTQLVHRTMLWAALQSTLAALPLTMMLGADGRAWARLVKQFGPVAPGEAAAFYTAAFSVFGSWLGAIPIPLDWDRPWQVWPVSCVYGCMGGYILGLVVAFVALLRADGKSVRARA